MKKKYKSSMDAGNYDPEIDGQAYTTYYKYEAKLKNVPSEIVYKGDKYTVDTSIVQIQSVRMLSLKELKELFKGTDEGIITSYTGDFKTDLYESKYYTPEIEEFHVGFEFDAYNKELKPKGNEWFKYTLGLGTDAQWGRIEEDLEKKHIRVKYLDQEDIESLGFKESPRGGRWDLKVDEYNDIQLYMDLIDNWKLGLGLSIYGDHGGIVFQGYIKNKSELKKLLKQLGVE